VKLAFAALDDGAKVTARVTVANARNAIVFSSSTVVPTIRAGEAYSVSWRTAKSQAGTFRFCVRAVLPGGRQSAQSCASVVVKK